MTENETSRQTTSTDQFEKMKRNPAYLENEANALMLAMYQKPEPAEREALILKALRAAAEASALSMRKWKPTHRHYKGGLYRIIAEGRIEADLSPVVIYDNEKGETWVRPVDDFNAEVNGEPRFLPLIEPKG